MEKIQIMETTDNSKKYVVGIGELLWDCFPTYRRMGVAPANFAYHVSQFGFDSVVVSAVGDDKKGEALIKELKSHNLDYCVEKVGLPTGTVDVNITDANDPQYTISTEVAWSYAGDSKGDEALTLIILFNLKTGFDDEPKRLKAGVAVVQFLFFG